MNLTNLTVSRPGEFSRVESNEAADSAVSANITSKKLSWTSLCTSRSTRLSRLVSFKDAPHPRPVSLATFFTFLLNVTHNWWATIIVMRRLRMVIVAREFQSLTVSRQKDEKAILPCPTCKRTCKELVVKMVMSTTADRKPRRRLQMIQVATNCFWSVRKPRHRDAKTTKCSSPRSCSRESHAKSYICDTPGHASCGCATSKNSYGHWRTHLFVPSLYLSVSDMFSLASCNLFLHGAEWSAEEILHPSLHHFSHPRVSQYRPHESLA